MTARISRIAVTAAAAAAVALSAAGCEYFNPTQTHDFYQAADGTNAFDKGIGLRNAIVIVDDQGNGTLFGSVTNETAKSGSMQLEGLVDGQSVFSSSVAVDAHSAKPLGGKGEQQITMSDLKAKPGDIMQLKVTVEGQGTQTISLPVADDSLVYYKQAEQSDGGK